MKTHSFIKFLVLSSVIILTAAANAATVTWTGADYLNSLDWSDANNWSGGVPSGNAALFPDGPAPVTGTGTTVNNIVSSSIAITGLTFTNCIGPVNTQIATGQTLTVNGNVVVGLNDENSNTTVNISGSNCAFTVTSTGTGYFDVLPATSSSVETVNLTLADGTNTLNVGTLNVGNTDGGNSKTSTFKLGNGTNILNTGTNNIGLSKGVGIMEFAGSSGSITMTGAGGTGRTYILLGDGSSGSGVSAGTLNFAGHQASVMASTLTMGADGGSDTGTGDSGTVTFDTGTFDVTTIQMGQTTTSSSGKSSTGTFTAGGSLTPNAARLIINSPSGPGSGKLVLGNTTTTGETGSGALNILTNCAAQISCNITKANATQNTGTITINGGSFTLTGSTNVIGTASVPIDNMNLTGATLTFGVASASTAPINVTTLTIDGSTTDTNFFDITSLPAGTVAPAVITLINAAALNNSGGNFNCALSAPLPAGYYGSIAKNGNSIVLSLTNPPSASATIWTGSDLPNHNTNWADANNWSTLAAPGSISPVVFNSSGANSSASSSALASPGGGPGAILTSLLNNIVNSSFSIASLSYTNINGTFENTSIAANDVLSINSGSLTVGSGLADFGNTTGNVTISGPAGTLKAATAAGVTYVGLGTAVANGSSPPPQAMLDLSGLATFISSNANFLVGVGGYTIGAYTNPQPSGVVYLAQTNIIYAASPLADTSDASPVALEVGDADTLAGLPSMLYLGRSNAIYADNISTARQLASGGIFFNPNVTSANPTAYIRGYSASAVASWIIGDGALNTTSPLASAGANDFTGGSVNALVNSIYVGMNPAVVSASGQVAGTLSFNAGTINANNLGISYNGAASDGNVYASAQGAVNVGGPGLLVVNAALNLAYIGGSPAYAYTPAGILNITNGGSVWANTILPGTNGAQSVISLQDGTLVLSNTAGTASAPLTSLDVTNATLDLTLAYAAVPTPAVNVSTLNAGGVTNIINILSLPALASSSYPATFTLIQASSLNGSYNFGLGSLPSATPPYAGSLSQSGNDVLLTLTAGPASVRPYVVWDGADSNDATNWTDGQDWQEPGSPSASDNVIFNQTDGQGSPALSTAGGGITALNAGSINNVVNANFTISSLTFTNIGSSFCQNTLIAGGLALNITGSGSLTAGSGPIDFGAGAAEFVDIAGANGTLNVNNTSGTIFVGLGDAGSTSEQATLDMSALGTFNADVSRFLIGVGSTAEGIATARECGIVYLAQTNTITNTVAISGTESSDTGATAASLAVGDNDGNSGATSYLYLGQTNAIFADAICVSRQKQSAQMLFNSIYNNSSPSAYFRGNSASAVAIWSIADGVDNGGTTTLTGVNDFSLGTVNALVSTMYVGRQSEDTGGAGTATATLTYGAGIFNVATLYIGYQPAASPKIVNGTVNVNANSSLNTNATLVVSGVLNLGVGTTASTASGTLNLDNGVAQVNSLVAGAGQANAINLYGGTLILTNASGTLSNLTLSPSTDGNTSNLLQIPPVASGGLTVATLTIDGASSTTNVIDISIMPAITSYPAEIPLIQYTTFNEGSGTLNIGLGTFPSSRIPYAGAMTNDTVNNMIAVVVTSGPVTQPLTWDGDAGANWNYTEKDWRPAAGPDTNYLDTDTLTFDDSLTSGHNTINIAATVQPGSMTFNNSASNTYTFTGSGGMAGSAGLNVLSNGAVILDNSGGNTFTGLVILTNGTLQIGANDTNGSMTASVTNAAPGALAFNRTDDLGYAGLISGNGTLVKNNTNILTLSGSNTNLYGSVNILQGALRLGAANALGSGSNASIVVSSGATLDFNSVTGTNFVIVAGAGLSNNGALVNNGPAATDFAGVSYLTMAGNTTIGGLQRWDLRNDITSGSGTQPTNFSYLSTSGQPYNLTKVGTNFIGLVSSSIDPALANIDVQAGTLDYEGTCNSLGNPADTLTIETGATLEIYNATNGLNKILVFKDGSTNINGAGTNTIFGPVTLSTNAAGGPGTVTFNIGGTSQLLTNIISGPGNLIVAGGLPLYLSASNTYTGSTLVSTGAVFLINTGSIGQSSTVTISSNAIISAASRGDLTFTAPSGQTLQGGGNITGSLVAQAGSTVAPGTPAATGVLTISSGVTLAGTARFKINNTAGGSNDVLASQGGPIAYGGTLQIINMTANAFTAGQSFQLFSAASYSGAFAGLVPATPGTGLAWNTNNLAASGTLSVVASATPSPASFTAISLSGATLTLSGANGIPNGQYVVLTSTNLAQGWTPVVTNNFSANGDFSFTETYSSTNQAIFYTIEQP